MYSKEKELLREMLNRGSRRQRGAGRIVALFIMPVVFCLIASVTAYVALEPFVGHYASAAMLLVGGGTQEAQPEARDLFAQVSTEDFGEPVEWVEIDDHINIDEETAEEAGYIRQSELIRPNLGDLFANITISGTEVDAPVFWGDREIELNQGVGTSLHGWLPGFGRTVMMKAHRNTDFMDLGSTEIGAIITVTTHYGIYTYEVVRIAVYHMDDTSSFDLMRDEENIILYTCYPFDVMGAAVLRFFVYGEPLTGTPVARYIW